MTSSTLDVSVARTPRIQRLGSVSVWICRRRGTVCVVAIDHLPQPLNLFVALTINRDLYSSLVRAPKRASGTDA